MKRKEIFEKVVEVLRKKHNRIDMTINYETSLTNGSNNSLDLTSLEIVELIVEIEDLFDIIIDFDIVYITIGDIVNDVERMLKKV